MRLPSRRDVVEIVPDGPREGQHLRRDLGQLLFSAALSTGVRAEADPQRIVVGEQAFEPALDGIGIGQVADPDRAAADLVLISRADAAPGGADLQPVAEGILAHAVELAVDRQDQRGIVGDAQGLRRHLDALAAQPLDLVQQRPGIDHHAVADDRELARPDDAGGQQAQLVGLVADDKGMAGIVAALEAHHDIRPRRQPVDDLAFALVAPLGADNDHISHVSSPSNRFRGRFQISRPV